MKYTNQDIQQQIEAYLRQDMSDLERSGFERRMHENPELHEEVQHQDSLMKAIRNERMLQLKAGLQSVPVSLWTASLVEYAKIAAISVGIGLTSAGVYLLFQDRFNESASEKQNIVIQENSSESGNKVIRPLDLSDEDLKSGKSASADNVNLPSSNGSKVDFFKNNTESVDIRQPDVIQQKGTSTELELPEPVQSHFQPSTPQNFNLPEDRLNNKTHPASMQPEVVIKRDNREKFHYQFSDGKLVLYADFNEKLYEVLELNQYGVQNLYLSYDGKFFKLDPLSNEISPLKEVSDLNLIQILTEYHKRK